MHVLMIYDPFQKLNSYANYNYHEGPVKNYKCTLLNNAHILIKDGSYKQYFSKKTNYMYILKLSQYPRPCVCLHK